MGPQRPSGGGGCRRLRANVAAQATVPAGQDFDQICVTFDAQVTYRYRNADGYQDIAGDKKSFTGCVDLTQTMPTHPDNAERHMEIARR